MESNTKYAYIFLSNIKLKISFYDAAPLFGILCLYFCTEI